MTPKAYMIVGVFAGLTASIVHLAYPDIMLVTMAWAAGALFGKGYGLKEAREAGQ